MLKQDFIALNPMTPTKDKMSRARAISARMRSGGVQFDKEAEWYPDLEQECLLFPKAKHDDQVDTLSWIGITLNRLIEADTPEEQAERVYQDELQDSYFNLGRSAVTGY